MGKREICRRPIEAYDFLARRSHLCGGVFSAALQAAGAELSGVVLEAHDGDTLTLANWQYTYRIRLVDIDAPELKQPYGRDAAASLFHMCVLKKATAETTGDDRYGRVLARVTCAGVDVNTEQVRRGWAWMFDRYAPKNSPLYGVQAEAKAAKRGLWADNQPVPPWEWRRMKAGNR